MNRKEALEFLELAEPASERDIVTRIAEKQTYFTHLCANAPNDFLKRLHEGNLEKILLIREMLGMPKDEPKAAPKATPVYSQPPYRRDIQQEPVGDNGAGGELPVAWLVRHTENQSAKTYPLYIGRNIAGRSRQSGGKMVLIDDDPYVSNTHAVLEILHVAPLKILVSDDTASNNGKPSRNGTYINGNMDRIAKPVLIGENDTIQIGYTKLIVRANKAPVHQIIRDVEDTEFVKTVVINIY